MKSCEVIEMDIFASEPGKGNPAGVVLNGDDFTSEEMQQIATKVGFNETVFLCKSDKADLHLRYFTPGHEMPLCGHATLGSVFAVCDGKLSKQLTIETGAGLLTVDYNHETQWLTMEQSAPIFESFSGDIEKLCASIGIESQDLYPNLPISYGNTGVWTLLVPVKSEAVLDKMVPATQTFPEILTEIPRASIHPFTIIDKEEKQFSARHFSSPFSGTVEDSVTGTASGVMGAYFMNHLYPDESEISGIIHQGKQLGREGQVIFHLKRNANGAHKVKISGTACYHRSMQIAIP